MRDLRRLLRAAMTVATASAVALVAALALAPLAASASAATAVAALPLREAISGTWVGTYAGFENGTYARGFERFDITTVRGANVLGTWQFRNSRADPWSDKTPMQLVALPTPGGGWNITGGDRTGTYAGRLDAKGRTLDLAYQSFGESVLTYRFLLQRR